MQHATLALQLSCQARIKDLLLFCTVEELLHEAGIAHTGSLTVFARLMRDEAFSSSLDEPSQFKTIDLVHRNACPSLTSSLQLQPGKCWDPSGIHRAYPSMPVDQDQGGRAGLGPAVGRRRRASSD